MKTTKTIGNWQLTPSADGKLHYITSPDSCLNIQIDTDDYSNATAKEILQLLEILSRHWPKQPKWEKITKKTIGDLIPLKECGSFGWLDKEWAYWASAEEVYSEPLSKCSIKPEEATHILYISK